MIHNLTDKQLQALRWLAKQVRSGKLEESFVVQRASIVYLAPQDDSLKIAINKNPVPDFLDFGVLDALLAEGVIVSSSSNRYTLRKKAYKIADFDFDNPKPDPISPVPLMPDVAKIRQLLVDVFDDEEFISFCSDYFSSVYDNFGAGMTKGHKIQLLLDYCIRRGELPRLLQLVQANNPYQYSRFIKPQ